MWTCFFFSSSFLASDCFLLGTMEYEGSAPRNHGLVKGQVRDKRERQFKSRGSGYSRAVERADVTVGGFLLDGGGDDGRVWDAGGVQTVVRGHHVWGEPRGQKTV